MNALQLMPALEVDHDHDRTSNAFTLDGKNTRFDLILDVSHTVGTFSGVEWFPEFYVATIDAWVPLDDTTVRALPLVTAVGTTVFYPGDFFWVLSNYAAEFALPEAPLRIHSRGVAPHTAGSRVGYSMSIHAHTGSTISFTAPLVARD